MIWRRALVCLTAAATGCATIPSGSAAVVTSAGGRAELVGEGAQIVSPLSIVEQYDLRAQERDEDLVGVTSDGAPVEARASLVTYSIVPEELLALDQQIGRDYYEVVIRPIVRSTVRLVLAGYRADQLDSPTIIEAGRQITQLAASRLRPFHIVLDAIDLRTLAILLSSEAYKRVVDIGVLEQKLLAQPQKLEVARQRGEELRQRARAIAAANAKLSPTLTPEVLADDALRATTALMAAPATHLIVGDGKHPMILEVP